MPPKKRTNANPSPPSLPDELWSAIFVEIVQRAEDLLFYLPRRGETRRTEYLCKALARTRLRLTRVCSRWRAIALTTPQLWITITSPWDQPNEGPFYAHLPVQLARCGLRPRPLAIFDMGKLDLQFLWHTLIKLSVLRRVQRLHVAFEFAVVFDRLLTLSFPALEELSVESVGDDEIREAQAVALLTRFSTLRVLVMQDINMQFDNVAPLVKCVSMPRLEKCILIRIPLKIITKCIAAPILETVQLHMVPKNAVTNISTGMSDPSYLLFPEHQLRELVVGGQVDHEHLAELLQHVSQLRTLRIVHAKRRNFQVESSLDLLMRMDAHHEPIYVPCLETLCYNKARMDKQDLEEFVRSRLSIATPTLKKVQLTKTALLGAYRNPTAAGSSEVLMRIEMELDLWHPDWE